MTDNCFSPNTRMSLLFKLLSQQNALAILNLLQYQSLPAGKIAQQLNLTPKTVTYQLSKLRKTGLVEIEGSGKNVRYRLKNGYIQLILTYAMLLGERD